MLFSNYHQNESTWKCLFITERDVLSLKCRSESYLLYSTSLFLLGKEMIEKYFDFRLFRLWKTRQHSKLLDYEDLLWPREGRRVALRAGRPTVKLHSTSFHFRKREEEEDEWKRTQPLCVSSLISARRCGFQPPLNGNTQKQPTNTPKSKTNRDRAKGRCFSELADSLLTVFKLTYHLQLLITSRDSCAFERVLRAISSQAYLPEPTETVIYEITIYWYTYRIYISWVYRVAIVMQII